MLNLSNLIPNKSFDSIVLTVHQTTDQTIYQTTNQTKHLYQIEWMTMQRQNQTWFMVEFRAWKHGQPSRRMILHHQIIYHRQHQAIDHLLAMCFNQKNTQWADQLVGQVVCQASNQQTRLLDWVLLKWTTQGFKKLFDQFFSLSTSCVCCSLFESF